MNLYNYLNIGVTLMSIGCLYAMSYWMDKHIKAMKEHREILEEIYRNEPWIKNIDGAGECRDIPVEEDEPLNRSRSLGHLCERWRCVWLRQITGRCGD